LFLVDKPAESRLQPRLAALQSVSHRFITVLNRLPLVKES
jgi:hypothetical protein